VSDASGEAPGPDLGGSRPRLGAGGVLAACLVALFVIGLVGWLVQGAGDDETVPTVPFTTAPPPTPLPIAPPTVPPAVPPTVPVDAVTVPPG
jgi:hypothetical protein